MVFSPPGHQIIVGSLTVSGTLTSQEMTCILDGQRDNTLAEFRQPQLNFKAGLRFERLKDAIVRYLRELGSAEESVADTRDRKEWKSSSLHSADLKAHRQIGMNLVHKKCSDYDDNDGIQGDV